MKREDLLNGLSMIVVIGLIIYQSVAVHAAPGDLDLTFGIGGKVMTQSGYDDKVTAAVIQADGRIVVAGQRYFGGTKGLLARYNPNGSLDQSFGIGGFVIDAAHGGHHTVFTAVVVQTDGKIVAAGYFYEPGGCMRYQSWAVRYNPNGFPDTTFGSNGAVEVPYIYVNGCPVDSYHYALAIQNDGKILLAGTSRSPSLSTDFAATRLNTDGSLDTSFNIDGLATFAVGASSDAAHSVAVQPNGKIVLAGLSYSSGTSNNFGLVVLGSQGLYDWNFGGSGKVITNLGGVDSAYAVAFQNDGKIIAAGVRSDGPNATGFALARYNTNGSLDSSFGVFGKIVTPFGGTYDMAFGIALQSNGRAVAAGRGADNNAPFTGSNFALSRYNPNGSLDNAFSVDGKQMTDFSNYEDEGRAVVIQADGKIVVAGYSSNGNNDSDIALARYIP